jgi:hypothetical protein
VDDRQEVGRKLKKELEGRFYFVVVTHKIKFGELKFDNALQPSPYYNNNAEWLKREGRKSKGFYFDLLNRVCIHTFAEKLYSIHYISDENLLPMR